jgi:hypothetical protein
MRCAFGLSGVLVAGALSQVMLAPVAAASPFADEVISYVPGVGAAAGYGNPNVALGSPERFTGEGAFPAAVTPFNGPWLPDEILSIGRGGSLTVRFDEPVVDDPSNPFGVDLLIFSNAFFFDPETFAPIANAVDTDGGTVEVSADGVIWHTIQNGIADGTFPTLGYSDLTDPYAVSPGAVLSDFTKPVNPALNWLGMDMVQLVAAYDGSGGGIGIDFAGTGLSEISFVRVSLAADAPGNIEIDAFSDVAAIPAPGGMIVVGAGALAGLRRRRPIGTPVRVSRTHSRSQDR